MEAGGGDTSKAIHRILIDATLKAFRGRIPENLKNPISQLGPSSSSSGEGAKTEFYPHPNLVKLEVERKSFARFLPFLPVFDFENWILGSSWFPLKRQKYSVRQNSQPMGELQGSNSILYVEYLHCRLLLSTHPEIHFQSTKNNPSKNSRNSSRKIFFNLKAFPGSSLEP